MGGRGRGLVRGRRISLLTGGKGGNKGWDGQAGMMRIGEMKRLAGERFGQPSLLRCRCVSGWNFLDLDIFRGLCG